VAVASPDGESVLLSTAASWPADQTRRDGPVRVLDLVGSNGVPRMMPLQAAGQAEWRLEEASHGRVRLVHIRKGRYLHMPGVSGFFQALLQLWSGEPHMDSSKVPNINTLFVLTPPEALEELKTLGLVRNVGGDPGMNLSLHLDLPYISALRQNFQSAFTDVRQYLSVHKGLVIGGFLGLLCLACCTWCCCLGRPTEEQKARSADAPTQRPSSNYVRRAPRRNV
jgi:hypothetical protein